MAVDSKGFWGSSLVAAAVAALVATAVVWSIGGGSKNEQIREEGAYERVIRTGTIRAGFVSYPPGSIVDPKSKEVSGIFPDLLREIGKTTGLKVEFTEEVGWATLIEGLETKRYDIIGGVWANPNRGKMATISVPVYYSGVGVWVRPDETRFSSDNNWSSINDRSVKIAAIDGSTPLGIAKAQFPNAQLVTYPNLTSEAQLFLDVTQRKVDVFFAEPAQGLLFLRSNPGLIKNIAARKPLRVFANVFLMKRNEAQLKTLIDTAIEEMRSSGVVDSLLRKYEPVDEAFYRSASPFKIPD